MNIEKTWEKDGFILRPAKAEDVAAYFEQNYNPLEKEVARMTGCKEVFSREEVISFFERAVADDDYCYFLLIAPDGRIVGESVINEIEWDVRKANFRIAIFHQEERGHGIGRWMVETTRDYAFEELKLHRLELDVYSFNERAARLYESAGFRQEGILRDAVLDDGNYADDILLAILEEDWHKLKKGESVVIRDYEETDWQRLMEIHDAARKLELQCAGLSDAFVPLAIAAEREGLFEYQVRVLCVEGEGTAAGFVAYGENEIGWLYVAPEYMRRGFGKQLVADATKYMVMRPLELEVLEGNLPAVRLYEACGFQIRETLSGVMPGNESFAVRVHVMERQ